MFGPWDQKKSHMYLALVSLGYTEKLSGAGGSYGYGKAGLITGSRIRTVVAYTCFQEQPNDPGVTRRLLGMTYWGQHDLRDENYTGFGSLSAGLDGRIEPYINEEADHIAASVGIRLRDPQVDEQLGTTFLLFDPTVEPADLLTAVERSWWPALQEADFLARVSDYDGSTHYPRPKRDELLRSFIDAWELASAARPAGPDEYRAALTGTREYRDIGKIGLVADMSGWSYADEKAGLGDIVVDHKSLVALTRGPRMVVEYFIVGSSEPYLRGVFIADESIDDMLRRTEPKAHDSWQRKGQEGEVDFAAAAVADHVLRRITQACNNQRARLKPPVPPPEDMNLPFFDEIMRRVMSGMGGGTHAPILETRPISIHIDYRPVQAGDRIRILGSASFSLSDHFKGTDANVELSIAYRFLEDDRVGELAAVRVRGPLYMQQVGDGVFRGRLDVRARPTSSSNPSLTNRRGPGDCSSTARSWRRRRSRSATMSRETRTIRPFVGVDLLAGCLNQTLVHFGQESCTPDSTLVVDAKPHEYLLRPATLALASDDASFAQLAKDLLDGSTEATIPLDALSLTVIASTPFLKTAELVFQRSLAALDSMARTVVLTEPERPAPFSAPFSGFVVDVYLMLSRTLNPRPLRPHRMGTWIARNRFTVETTLAPAILPPTPLTDELRKQLDLPAKAIRFIDFGDHDLFESYHEQIEPTFYVDDQLLAQLNVRRSSASSKALQMQLAGDFVSAVIRKAAREPEKLKSVSYGDLRASLLGSVIRLAAGPGATDDHRDRFSTGSRRTPTESRPGRST